MSSLVFGFAVASSDRLRDGLAVTSAWPEDFAVDFRRIFSTSIDDRVTIMDDLDLINSAEDLRLTSAGVAIFKNGVGEQNRNGTDLPFLSFTSELLSGEPHLTRRVKLGYRKI